MPLTWNVEQITALAPDASSAKAGKGLAAPRHWLLLGRDERAAWGECQGSAKEPYRTQVDLNDLAFRCSCPSRKLPCKHGLGLLYLLSDAAQVFTSTEPPEWVQEWLAGRQKRAEQRVNRETQPEGERKLETGGQTKRQAERTAKVEAGLQELELWLRDLVRNGLAAVQTKPYSYWENIAARMVDAQAPGMARLLKDAFGLAGSGQGWQERMLERLGKIYLLLEGFKRLETLPAETQADLRSLIGWTQDQADLLAEAGIQDQWLVVGQRVEEEERMRVQRTWLWGRQSEQAALLLHFAPPGQNLDKSLVVGSQFEAELVFFVGAYPLRALIKQRLSTPENSSAANLPGHLTIAEARATYAQALARNPWLEQFPMILAAAIPSLQPDQSWIVKDPANYSLPLSPSAGYNSEPWPLLALSGGHPLKLFGEWDGAYFKPLTAWQDDKMLLVHD